MARNLNTGVPIVPRKLMDYPTAYYYRYTSYYPPLSKTEATLSLSAESIPGVREI